MTKTRNCSLSVYCLRCAAVQLWYLSLYNASVERLAAWDQTTSNSCRLGSAVLTIMVRRQRSTLCVDPIDCSWITSRPASFFDPLTCPWGPVVRACFAVLRQISVTTRLGSCTTRYPQPATRPSWMSPPVWFTQRGDQTVTVVAFAEFENVIEIYRDRNVVFGRDRTVPATTPKGLWRCRHRTCSSAKPTRPGRHWICIFVEEYFDSFGTFERYLNRHCS